MTGIYFLLCKGIVVYIGQTCNLVQRLRAHNDKKFDGVRLIECDGSKLNYYEQRWIKIFRPKYNKIKNPDWKPGARNKRKGEVISVHWRIERGILNALRKRAEAERRNINAIAEMILEEFV